MTTPPSATVDRPSLAAAGAIGACVGLAIGSAYIAGALARASVEDAQAKLVATTSLRAPLRPRAPVAQTPPPTVLARAAAPLPAPPLSVHAATAALMRVDLRGPAAPSRDLECLSQAVYYEARGEAERGRQAVAQVVMNRAHHPRFPKSICGVVFQHAASGCAFSFACDGQTHHALEPGAWRDARRIAQRTLAGFVLPELRTATDFRSGGYVPQGLERVAQIGAHVFYRWTGHAMHAVAAPAPAVHATSAPTAPVPPAAPEKPVVVKADAPARPEAAAPPTPAAAAA